jgi:hypothetical protein
MRAADVALGTHVRFKGERSTWTVAGSRRTKKGIVFRLVMEEEGFKGNATTKPLPDDYEIEVVS